MAPLGPEDSGRGKTKRQNGPLATDPIGIGNESEREKDSTAYSQCLVSESDCMFWNGYRSHAYELCFFQIYSFHARSQSSLFHTCL